ncbi:MAG: glycosyltransferase [bacterium]|nr:glycosyltransferase [bacterium]
MIRPPVAVVVPVLNHGATLPGLLRTLAATDWPDLTIIAVDCGSTDGSLAILRQAAEVRSPAPGEPRLTLIERPGSGRASALNAGFEAAERRDVVRLHGDVLPDRPDWLQRLHAAMIDDPNTGVVGAKITLASGRIQSCGRRIITGLGIAREWSDLRWLEDDRDESPQATEVDSVSGELCLIRRAVLDATQGLDPAFDPVFVDDDDFCLLARYHGFRVLVERGVRGVHFTRRRTPLTGPTTEPSGQLESTLAQHEELRHSALAHFARKWGFDPNGPDLHEIRRRYGHTRICWQIGEALREDLPERPAVDVCFPTWNSMTVLPRAMAHLAATRWQDVRIWITDNGSTDGTLEYLDSLRASFPFPIHVEQLRLNVGCAQALNLAIERGSAEIVARIDDDTMVAPDWLERLIPRFHQRPFAGIVGPKIFSESESPALQAGPSRQWPSDLPLDTEQHERASGLARVTTLRGCCNVYRRSVFATIGLLDPRFSPSQFDEWDHQVAAAVRGYEILYDGSTSVHHLITAGRQGTPASLANLAANRNKSNAKWGGDHFERLERGIDLSIDGRFLPADGDTTALRARLTEPPAEPPPRLPRAAQETAHSSRIARRRSLMQVDPGPLTPFFDDLVKVVSETLDDPRQRIAPDLVRQLEDFATSRADALVTLARFRLRDGNREGATQARRWARMIAPAIELDRPTDTATSEPALDGTLDPLGSGPRILVLPPADAAEFYATLACDHAVTALRRAGAQVVVDRTLNPDATAFDAVHAFGLGQADTLLGRLQCARATNPDVRIVLSSLTANPETANWIGQLVGSYFQAPGPELDALFAAAAAGKVTLEGQTDRRLPHEPFDGSDDYERRTLALADTWIVHRPEEADWLGTRFPGTRSAICVPEGVDLPAAAAAAATVPTAGVLQVGPRDLLGNHLPLVLAMRGTDLPLTLCGPAALPYGDATTAARADFEFRTLPRPRTPGALTATMRRSAVCAWLPNAPSSFVVPLLAARAGCELVLARGVGAEEVFGLHADYVDPLDLPALRAAIDSAHERWSGRGDEAWRDQIAVGRDAASYGQRLLSAYGIPSPLVLAGA